MSIKDENLELTTAKIKRICKRELDIVADTGLLPVNSPFGLLLAVLSFLGQVMKIDSQAVEALNSLIRIQSVRNPSISLELVSGRVQLKKAVIVTHADGTINRSKTWSAVKPFAIELLHDCESCGSMYRELLADTSRWKPPLPATNMPISAPLVLDPRLKPTIASAWAAKFSCGVHDAIVAINACDDHHNRLLALVVHDDSLFGAQARTVRAYLISTESCNKLRQCFELESMGAEVDSADALFDDDQAVSASVEVYRMWMPLRAKSTLQVFIELYDQFQSGLLLTGMLIAVDAGCGSTFRSVGQASLVPSMNPLGMTTVLDSIVNISHRCRSPRSPRTSKRKPGDASHFAHQQPARKRLNALGCLDDAMSIGQEDGAIGFVMLGFCFLLCVLNCVLVVFLMRCAAGSRSQ